jgi:hypothetical protein
MKPMEIQHGAGVRHELLLDASPNSAPAALQWEFRLPPGLQIAEIEEGEAIKKAGKTLVCNGARCLVYAVNRKKIPNGQIAIANIMAVQSSNGATGSAQLESRGRNRKQEVQIVDVVAASLDGQAIQVVPGSGAAIPPNTR